jgi:hypothetical protein
MRSRTIMAMVLAFLVPGAGHFYLGRRGRAAAFFGIIIFLFVVGVSIDGRLYVPESGNLLGTLAALASMGVGLPYFIARAVGVPGDITSITFEYGTMFALSAGLMNLLLILDSFDIAEDRKK